jgi:hypothetical protein
MQQRLHSITSNSAGVIADELPHKEGKTAHRHAVSRLFVEASTGVSSYNGREIASADF